MSDAVKFTIELDRAFVWDLFVTAMESGYSPWVRAAKLNHLSVDELCALEKSRRKDPRLVWWGHDCMREATFTRVYLEYLDEEDRIRNKILTWCDLTRGLSLVAREAPKLFAYFLADDQDGPSADAWLQCAVFGKVVYG